MRNRANILCLLCAACPLISSSHFARAQKPFDTEISQIGDAQVQTMVDTGFFPDRQPVVFWHDPQWSIDLLLPANSRGELSVRIQSPLGVKSIITLPESARQIKSIVRAPEDKAIVNTEGSEDFGIVILNLKKAKVTDDVVASEIQISPNRRFALFDSWFANWDDSVPHTYRLYDVLKSPQDNTCGYSVRDPKHTTLENYFRGIEVFPPRLRCSDSEPSAGLDDATNFAWTPDSSRIVFADAVKGVMNLVVVTMPTDAHDLPKTSLYALIGSNNVCVGENDADSQKTCDPDTIRYLGWDGDSVKVTLHRPYGTPRDLQLTLPMSAFLPAQSIAASSR